MPAITVDDPPHAPRRRRARPRGLGRAAGPVGHHRARRVRGRGLPRAPRLRRHAPHLLDPFIHMDQMGEVDYAPGEPGARPWHPHRGFETVTYMIDGTFQHQDSTGGGGLITNGDTQWMTAGSGILHIERPPEDLVASGGLFHGVQLWVNLPAADKFVDPRYQDIRGGQVKLLRSPDGGAVLRLIAGTWASHEGPGITHTPITYVHATVAPGARLVVPWSPDYNALVYVLAGQGTVGSEGRPVRTGRWRLRPRRPPGAGGRRHPGLAHPQPRGAAARRAAHPGARGPVRPVRHEHPGRAGAGVRGLPVGQDGPDPGRPRRLGASLRRRHPSGHPVRP